MELSLDCQTIELHSRSINPLSLCNYIQITNYHYNHHEVVKLTEFFEFSQKLYVSISISKIWLPPKNVFNQLLYKINFIKRGQNKKLLNSEHEIMHDFVIGNTFLSFEIIEGN